MISKFLRFVLIVLIFTVLLVWGLLSFTSLIPADIVGHVSGVLRGETSLTAERTPGELIRHARQRLAGHPKLEFLAIPLLDLIQPHFERPVPQIVFPRFGKGQQLSSPGRQVSADYLVATVEQLTNALQQASAGQVIELLPGAYRINKMLSPRNPGREDQRITLRASKPNVAILEINTTEGFLIAQPFWVFENLRIVGVCKVDDYCEHAFHIVAGAHHSLIRNNHIEDFSAHIKINGDRGKWPDDGVVEHNTLTNTRPRNTSRPVTPFDLVGASRWVVADNYVANFIKADPKATSFGIFMKGAGVAGRIERNVVVCTHSDISQAGTRVGISFGGGETGLSYCRDGECEVEFSGGKAFNNIVAHCNDVGIDVNRSRASLVAHNTLINTGGIDIRGNNSSAVLFGNLLEGMVRARKGGSVRLEMNEVSSMRDIFVDADKLDLRWRKQPEKIPSHAAVKNDLCSRERADGTAPGALETVGPC